MDDNKKELKDYSPVELRAVAAYAAAQKNKDNKADILSQKFGIDAGDKISIQLGYMPSYDGVEEQVLATEHIFDGTRANCLTFPHIKPFYYDDDTPARDFTLVLDLEYTYNENASTDIMVHCANT
jgi:hypothetical protein